MASSYVDSVYRNFAGMTGLTLWMSAFLYAVQIYADFSGYSEISNGLMKIIGFDVADNFYAPYFAEGFGEFWRRWHISFSSWLRDYVYIPLGGSRCSESRRFMNLLITFAVSGIWHGSGLNFLFWGISHGVLVYLSGKIKLLRNSLITFCLAVILWVPFRAVDIGSAVRYYACMFKNLEFSGQAVTSMVLQFTGDNTCVLYACVLFTGILIMTLYDWAMTHKKDWSFVFTVIFTMMIILLGRLGESAFIYAQF